MGTRGLMGFAHNGKVKAMYNHFDSYPTGLGEDIVKWIKSKNGDFKEAIEKFNRLEAVDSDAEPTMDQQLALLRYLNTGVSTGKSQDWYALLRDTQGNPEATLNAGLYEDSLDFARDSLFCEWAYIIDFDREVLEVYRGFQTGGEVVGRFAEAAPIDHSSAPGKYNVISLIDEIPFSILTTVGSAMEDLEKSIYDDDED